MVRLHVPLPVHGRRHALGRPVLHLLGRGSVLSEHRNRQQPVFQRGLAGTLQRGLLRQLGNTRHARGGTRQRRIRKGHRERTGRSLSVPCAGILHADRVLARGAYNNRRREAHHIGQHAGHIRAARHAALALPLHIRGFGARHRDAARAGFGERPRRPLVGQGSYGQSMPHAGMLREEQRRIRGRHAGLLRAGQELCQGGNHQRSGAAPQLLGAVRDNARKHIRDAYRRAVHHGRLRLRQQPLGGVGTQRRADRRKLLGRGQGTHAVVAGGLRGASGRRTPPLDIHAVGRRISHAGRGRKRLLRQRRGGLLRRIRIPQHVVGPYDRGAERGSGAYQEVYNQLERRCQHRHHAGRLQQPLPAAHGRRILRLRRGVSGG